MGIDLVLDFLQREGTQPDQRYTVVTGWGRGFESLRPLQFLKSKINMLSSLDEEA
jgi:hypothetical protein